MKTKCLIASVALVGCQATVPLSTTTTTSGAIDDVSVDHAAQDIASARCARELSCGNIGGDALDSCTRSARGWMRDVITAQGCASGIAPTFLSTCLENVRAERCGSARGLTERLATSCRDVKLCQ
jgi:hypothetical protein